MMAMGMAMPALAQQASGPQATAAEKDRNADVIVVTANKREESVQDIAVAVTAISSTLRDQIGLNTVQDYTNFAPGLTYSTASDRLGMRGVTRTTNNFGIRSGISNYVDGVYYSSAVPASRQPIFVDRVEVVRGPQGTLYGRDSIGGALNVISKRPTDTFEAQMNIGDDNFDHRKLEARIAGPITDWLRYSIAGSRDVQDRGYFHNYSGLETEGGRTDGYYIEGQLAGNITDKFDWWLEANRLEWTNKGAPGARTGVGSRQPYDTRYYDSTASVIPNAWYGLTDPNRIQLGTQNTNPAITDRRGFNTDFTNYAHLTPTSEAKLEAVYHAPAFDIKYLGGYVYYNYDLLQDNDGSPISQFKGPRNETIYSASVSDYMENRGWFSNEINFISTGNGPLQWTTGLYAYQENYSQTVFAYQLHSPGGPIYDVGALTTWLNGAGPLLGTTPPRSLAELPNGTGRNYYSGSQPAGSSLNFFSDNVAVNNAYGAFLQGDYKFNEQWKLTAGIRYSADYSRGREYTRVVNHYVVEDAFEAGYIPAYVPYLGAYGAAAPAVSQAIVTAAVPPRIDVTSTLGSADPNTVTAAVPCGFAGKGILNTNPTTANATGSCSDKTRYGIYIDPVSGNAYRDLAANWSAITGVLGIDWTPDADTLIYAKYNRGYKPGGFGAAAVFAAMSPTPYTDKETVDSIEGGYKKEWRNWNLTTDAVLYYYDYKGYQVTNTVIPAYDSSLTVQRSAYTPYLNLPKTGITGFELETTWRPLDDLRFLLNYGWNDPKIKKAPALVDAVDPYGLGVDAKPIGPRSTVTNPCTTVTPVQLPTGCNLGFQGQDVTGNILPYSPKNKIAVNGVYTINFEDGSKLDTSLSYFWQDIAYSSIFNRGYTKVPAWDQWDARLSWTSKDKHFTVIGYGKNIFNDIAYDGTGVGLNNAAPGLGRQVAPQPCFSSAATTSPLGGRNAQTCYTSSETLRPPRTYGIELQFRY
jgi:iron complex outermembrane receptor protein